MLVGLDNSSLDLCLIRAVLNLPPAVSFGNFVLYYLVNI